LSIREIDQEYFVVARVRNACSSGVLDLFPQG
jgi:hypothetical protein